MWQLGAFCIISNHSGHVLLSHRKDLDLWNLPGGGVEQDETPWDAAIREVREETGLEVAVERLVGIYTKSGRNGITLCFECVVTGGKVKNDRIDSEKIAQLLRSGMLPQAYAYPAQMRSTRDLLRRRMYLVRRQAELVGHIQNTRHQYNLPAFEKSMSRAANREGIADHFNDPMVAASIQVDSNMLDSLHQQILFVERQITEQARHHDPVASQLLRTIPGVGKTLGLTILYEIGDVRRFPSVFTKLWLTPCAWFIGPPRVDPPL
jgi:ADP-ribose pyrophosphatase YjhB (NUDIX family)